MVKGELTTILVRKSDKLLFNKLYKLYCETIIGKNQIPNEYFRKPTQAQFFSFLIEDYNDFLAGIN